MTRSPAAGRITRGRKERETMTKDINIKSVYTEVNRILQQLERAEAERIRRNYKPARTHRSEAQQRTRRGYSQPRPRYC